MTDWHAVIGDPNQADAICDRQLHRDEHGPGSSRRRQSFLGHLRSSEPCGELGEERTAPTERDVGGERFP